ncbi:hypothetical protein Ahy_B06g081487 [Arachis hypogaea]|uniref:Uncharacterized protein n=1 Tax=Arachis hypogaea TaxID=3818 RepID=A0A444YL54_ARAHY|nr:hypothetical protein Ahy_B06g081487 [Arachis hypogaea]
MGLGFYMRRKLLNVHIPDLAHLAERVRQVELMKEQKLKSKPFTRKEKVAYVTMESSEEEFDLEAEVDLAELKKGPPYNRDAHYRQNQQWGHRGLPQNQYPYQRGRARGYPRGRGRRNLNQNKKPQSDKGKGATPLVHSQIVFPSDGETCPKGILSPAKLEKGKAIAYSPGTDKGKEADLKEEYFEEGDDKMVGTILIIPNEYLGEYEGDPEEDYDMDAEEAFSFIRYEDEPGKVALSTSECDPNLLGLFILRNLRHCSMDYVQDVSDYLSVGLEPEV